MVNAVSPSSSSSSGISKSSKQVLERFKVLLNRHTSQKFRIKQRGEGDGRRPYLLSKLFGFCC